MRPVDAGAGAHERSGAYMRALAAGAIGLLLLFLCNGCVLTRALTVPMRVGGAVFTIIPGVGDAAHSAIDEAAEQIDDIPL